MCSGGMVQSGRAANQEIWNKHREAGTVPEHRSAVPSMLAAGGVGQVKRFAGGEMARRVGAKALRAYQRAAKRGMTPEGAVERMAKVELADQIKKTMIHLDEVRNDGH